MKKHIFKQEDESDCGACSLSSIISYYKGYVPLEIIKVDTFTNQNGTNFYYIKQASEKYGFDVNGRKTFNLNSIILPCIAQINIDGFNHFITIYNMDDDITYMDPSYGKVISSKEEFLKVFTGNILEFFPKGKIIRYKKNKTFQNMIKEIYSNNIKSIIFLLVLSILLIILSLISNFNILLIRYKKCINLIFILLIIKIIVSYIKNKILSHLNKNINDNLLKNYLKYIFNLPLKYLQMKKPGDFINRINDLNKTKDFFSSILVDAFINILFLIFSLILLFHFNYKITLILLMIVVIYLLILSYLNKDLYKNIINVIDLENQFIDTSIEYLNKISTIKTLNNKYFLNNLDNKIDNNLNSKLNLDLKLNKIEIIKNFFEELLFILILILHFKINSDYITLIIFISIYNYFIGSVKYFIDMIPSLLYFKDVFKRIKSIFDIEETKYTNNISKEGEIVISNLTYSYNNLDYIFNDFNLNIKKGNKVLIEGDNGSGKSTLLGLLSGLYTDYGGNITTCTNISYINQNSQLFSDSILNNIILDKSYNEERFKFIENITNLKEIIKNKTRGYNTNLNSIINLSGGEKQKIIIARALYNNFDVLILDESLSEISKNTRNKILSNIMSYYKDKTIIYVSHQNENINFNQRVYLFARKDNYVNRKGNV